MKTTLLTNVYNEEYLLPFWLEHHKDMFDDIIIIDYNSTDKSIEICRKICPTCKIITTRNANFRAEHIDSEFMDLEKCIDGIKIILNTTEFLLSEKPIKEYFLNETNPQAFFINQISPYSKNTYDNIKNNYELFGNLLNDDLVFHYERGYRQIHSFEHGNYICGRHKTNNPITITNDMHIIWFGYYPLNEKILKRKLQIQSQIPQEDKDVGNGIHHFVDREKLLSINEKQSCNGLSLKTINNSLYELVNKHVNELYNIYNKNNSNTYTVQVSLGEAIDKLNILELKMKKISDENKKVEIQKEIDQLHEFQKYKEKYDFFYNLLTFINEKIWDTTDNIKKMTISDPSFSELSNQIFTDNQKRFRIKSWFNTLENSNIKEQKSYDLTRIFITTRSVSTIYEKIAEINYLLLEYDIVYFIDKFSYNISSPLLYASSMQKDLNTNESVVLKMLFKQPNLYIYDTFEESQNIESTIIQLEEYTIFENEENKQNKKSYEFQPINYISGGMLGDFIYQLSVINEKFIETGKKGNLFIAVVGDNFRTGLENTYKDTYDIISGQVYINSYSIFNNEHIDINLSEWRKSPLLYHENWYKIFKSVYSIEWGSHPWLSLPKNNMWENKVIISYPNYRKIENINFQEIYEKWGNNLVFMSFDNIAYHDFINTYGITIDLYCPSTLYEFAVAINSCKFFIGGLSAPLTFAFALHKPHKIGLPNNNIDNVHVLNLDDVLHNDTTLL